MKLIIQIPCYNEEENIEKVLDNLPKKIDGIDKIEYMIINDGSTDNTRKLVEKNKVNYIIDIFPNKGLANAFLTGIDEALKKGADIIVNIDGDNQYSGKDIQKLVDPILKGKAEMVIGERQIEKFSTTKRFFQKLGSLVVRILSKSNVPDAPSGFRAYSRECAMTINVYNQFTYTLETIIQASSNKTKISYVKIQSFPNTRKSRLFKNEFEYIYKSMANLIKALFIYKPIKIWGLASFISMIMAIICVIFWGISFIFSFIFIIISIQFAIASMLSIHIQANRKQLEKIQYYIKKERYEQNGK